MRNPLRLVSKRLFLTSITIVGCFASTAHAEPQIIDAFGTLSAVDGSFLDDFAVGTPFDSTYTYDTDEANASSAITTPSVVPDHEFSSFYEFTGTPYGMFLEFPTVPDQLGLTFVGVVVNDNLTLTAAETNGAVADGMYDWIELLGSTTSDACLLPGGICAPDEFSPVDGVEVTVALISDTSWISDGSLVPDALPPTFTPVFVGIEYDAMGIETGTMFGTPTVVVNEAFDVPSIGPLGLAALVALLLLGGRSFLNRTGMLPNTDSAS